MSDNYITKEEVLSFVEEMEKRTHGDDIITKTVLATTKCIKDFVMHMSSADVQPVRYGEWIDTGSGQECSVCGEIQYGYDSGRHYCANCGVKIKVKSNVGKSD